jgi:hypothetical protein
MKQIALLIAIVLPGAGLAQAPQDHPQPAPAAASQAPLPEAPPPAATSSVWNRIQHLPRGEEIKVNYGRGPWDRCRFAGATDQYLFCEPGEDSGQAQEYRIDRFSIADFKIDHDERNGRLIYTGVVLGSGLALGILTAQNSHAEPGGIVGGLLGAGLGALVGVPFSCLSGHCVSLHLPPPQPMVYGIGYSVPLRRLPLRRR